MNKEFYKLKADLIKALANPIRLMIIDALAQGDKNVSELVEITGESQSNVSKCLSVLRSHGVIQDNKKGLNVYYSLKICCMGDFFGCLNEMLKEQHKNRYEILEQGGLN